MYIFKPPAHGGEILRGLAHLRHDLFTCMRHGKYLLARLYDGPWLTLHFDMTGRLKYLKRGAPRPPVDIR